MPGEMDMNLNWDDMRFFLSLCRTHSFTAAAMEQEGADEY